MWLDHCEAIWTVLEKGRPGETYNVGGRCERSNIDVVRTVCRADERIASEPRDRRLLLADYVCDRIAPGTIGGMRSIPAKLPVNWVGVRAKRLKAGCGARLVGIWRIKPG